MKIAQIEQRPQNRDCIFNLQLYIPYVSASAGGRSIAVTFSQIPVLLKSTLLSYTWVFFSLCQFVICKRKGLEDCHTATEDRERVIAVYFQIVVCM